MDWLLRGPKILSIFSHLGYVQADGYHVHKNCNRALEEILKNIQAETAYLLQNIQPENEYLQNYRRNIRFGQNIQNDLLPLLIHAKEDKTLGLLIKILVNLTVPIENMVEVTSRTDFGRHTIFEINNLLTTTKVAFTEPQTSKAVIKFLNKNVDVEPKKKLSEEQLNNVNNCLILLANILHIPMHNDYSHSTCNGSKNFLQNQIIWNIFSQSIDKVLIKAISIRNSKFYGYSMLQLVALFYKDKHVVTEVNKFLTNWHESSLSENSEDNESDESNTSSTDRGSDDSSSMLTSSDASSNSSDSPRPRRLCSKVGSATFGNIGDTWKIGLGEDSSAPDVIDDDKYASSQNSCQDNSACDDKSGEAINEDHIDVERTDLSNLNDCVYQTNRKRVISDTSDCGYGKQIKIQEFVSTDDDNEKPVHRKPHIAKQRPKNKPQPSTTFQKQEQKKRNFAKRVKLNVINIQGLFLKTPTDDDITNVIQEFTVDFLLKGFNSLVQTLYNEILLTNRKHKIDTSSFFILITIFLKFAAQMELNLELINSVLCFDILSYLVADAVNYCEQFELEIKLDGADLSPTKRRQCLAVSTICKFVEAIEVYKKIDDHEMLQKLHFEISEVLDLSSLMVLLLRHYNPRYHSKQYLKDLVVTNHILLTFLDAVQIPEYNCSTKIMNLKQKFATPAIMAQYGLLLGDFYFNGAFVNNCIFTLMHHVGGNANRLDTLLQPNIVMTFTAIWKSEFVICDDWNDMLKCVINTYTFLLSESIICDASLFSKQYGTNDILLTETSDYKNTVQEITQKNNKDTVQIADNMPQERWTEAENSALSWNYLRYRANPDTIGAITKQLKEDNIDKSRTSVIRELFRQNLITKDYHESQLKGVSDKNTTTVPLSEESRDEEIRKACEQLMLEGKSSGLEWVQKVLLEICHAKLLIRRKELQTPTLVDLEKKLKNYECFRPKLAEMPIVSPVVYHSLITQDSVPLVTWNCLQANICKDMKFLQLFHKLGFQMPVDTGRVFIRIPHVWTAEFIYTVAGKIRPIDTSTLKFSVCDLSNSENSKTKEYHTSDVINDGPFIESSNNFYQIQKPNFATMVNFTPTK